MTIQPTRNTLNQVIPNRYTVRTGDGSFVCFAQRDQDGWKTWKESMPHETLSVLLDTYSLRPVWTIT